MRYPWAIIWLVLLVFSYGNTYGKMANIGDSIVIKGMVTGIPAHKIYLRHAYSRKLIDSTENKNNSFIFHLDPKNFEPLCVSLYYLSEEGKIILFVFANYMITSPDKVFGQTAFYLSKGETIISGIGSQATPQSTNKLFLRASKEQNDVWFSSQFTNFGWIDPNTTSRDNVINGYMDSIKNHPQSFYYLDQIITCKRQYSNAELKKIYSLFDKQVRNSSRGMQLEQYFQYVPTNDLHNFVCTDTTGLQKNLWENGKSNVVIFWASWCSPCRLEIPYLKNLYAKFGSNKLNIVSVSIDKEHQDWLNAVRVEKMPWEQLYIKYYETSLVMSSYHFDAIPIIIVIDGNGKEITRFTDGYTGVPNKKLEEVLAKLSVED